MGDSPDGGPRSSSSRSSVWRDAVAPGISLVGVALTGWLTFQTHAIDGRVAALQAHQTQMQTFETRVFENVGNLLDPKRDKARLYLIGLYGQARGDIDSKTLVASIAAASCSKDLIATLNTLIATDTDDQKKLMDSAIIKNIGQYSSSLCIAPSSGNGKTVVRATPPPETVNARNALIATLTKPATAGWVELGTAPLGTETKPCIELASDASAAVAVIYPGTVTQPPRSWHCQPLSPGSVVLPGSRSGAQPGLQLRVLSPRTMYADYFATSEVVGVATTDHVVTLLDNVKGTDVVTAGKKSGYQVWAHVRLDPFEASDLGAPASTSPVP